MSITKYIYVYVSWQISVRCIFILRGGNISYIRKHFEKQIVAIFCCICCNVWHRIPGPGPRHSPLRLQQRSGAGENLRRRRSGFQLLVLCRGKITFSINLKLDWGVDAFSNLFNLIIDLTIWNVNYSYLTFLSGTSTVLRYSTKL